MSESLQLNQIAPDCTLPDSSRLSELRGQPVILAFAPDEWNPATAYQSELFAQLSREFKGGATFIDATPGSWHSLDIEGDLAAQFGVSGRRALLLLDENGALKWKIEVESGQNIASGEVLAALESLNATPTQKGGVSRRAFLSATLAAAALLTLTPGEVSAGPGNHWMPGMLPDRRKPAPSPPGTVPVSLKINGKNHKLQLEPRVALLDALRENLHLNGTKKGCDHGQCGACTIHVNGERQLACLTLAVMAQGKEITTIEGLAKGEELHPVQAAFIKHDAFQCGYCTPGQIMSAAALLKENRATSATEIRESMSGNLCRCAAYPNIINAIKELRS